GAGERQLHTGTCGLQSDPAAQALDGAGMSAQGKWRVVETPDYDMAGPGSYIRFDEDGGAFALDCLTGSIHGACEGNAVEFTWEGNDEMEEASGHGWAELRKDGSLKGEICLDNGDEITFIARRSVTSSTACLAQTIWLLIDIVRAMKGKNKIT